MKLTTEEDHRRLLAELGIASLRPGVNGMNPSAPNYANTDEAKANPYPDVPELMRFQSGAPLRTAADWQRRRKEILELLDREIYGRTPARTPKVDWRVLHQERVSVGSVPAVRKELVGRVDNSGYPHVNVEIRAALYTPADAKRKVPVILEFGFLRGPMQPPASQAPEWQRMVLAKGWGFSILHAYSVQADHGAGLTEGIIGLVNKGRPRKPDQWGALKAWAWGASRVLDYFHTDPHVDAKRVGIEGLSRFGKAAAVTMAYDPRFAVAFIGSSGQAGIKIWRRNFGETVENVASSGEYHWMAGNYVKYAGPLTPGDLPVDAHMLLALCAPRPAFVGVGSLRVEGIWIDPVGTFMATSLASPAYEVLGRKGLERRTMPEEGVALIGGDLAYRQHAGGHTNGPNWETFIQFASRYLDR